jgi:hypothetical protein
MGLTIYYTLSKREALADAKARELVGRVRTLAREAEVESVSRQIRVEPDFPLAHEFVTVPESSYGVTHVDVPPENGYIFIVSLGRDCEDLLLGLCRYPATAKCCGRDLPTKAGGGWRLRHFCKTQYASLHGWEHFFRCHRTAIELLNLWRTVGVNVEIKDEGGYWPGRSEKVLRERVGEMNGIVAAMSGALKDAAEGLTVESPIFDHPNFERLEHEGQQRHGAKVRKAVKIVGKETRRRK